MKVNRITHKKGWTLALSLSLCLFASLLPAQERPDWLPQGAVLAKKGTMTGRTTGHIVLLIVQNTSDQDLDTSLPPLEIPSDGTHQGYVVPEPTPLSIPAGRTQEITMQGYCTEAHLPAAPHGSALPSADTWRTNTPLLETLQRLGRAMTPMQARGELRTPYSQDPALEREVLLQHFTWIHASGPERYDPCRHLRSWLEGQGASVPASDPGNLNRAIARITDALIRVGRSAGIDAYGPPAIPADRVELQAPPTETGQAHPLRSGLKIKVSGTGRTTGHIADMIIDNPGTEDLVLRIGNGGSLYIPASEGFQAYVVPKLPDITVGAGQSASITVQGYCTDVRRPAVGTDDPMPPVEQWVSAPGGGTPDPGVTPIPTHTAPDPARVAEVLSSLPPARILEHWDCPLLPDEDLPLVPGTDVPIRFPLTTNSHPGMEHKGGAPTAVAVEASILTAALERITRATETLMREGRVSTPFQGDPAREEEAIIQQTFWIYSESLHGKPYLEVDFHDRTVAQYETASGQPYRELPREQRDRLDQGIDAFWQSFQAVGTEAKLLPASPPPSTPTGKEPAWPRTDPGASKTPYRG